jgi:hypothetical protein
MPATLTAPRTAAKTTDLRTLRHAMEPGSPACVAALESLGRKAGIEAHAARLRTHGGEWIERRVDRDWRSRDAVRAVRELQWAIARELTVEENGAFIVAMVDMMYDLV